MKMNDKAGLILILILMLAGLILTLSVPEKFKDLIFEIPIIPKL